MGAGCMGRGEYGLELNLFQGVHIAVELPMTLIISGGGGGGQGGGGGSVTKGNLLTKAKSTDPDQSCILSLLRGDIHNDMETSKCEKKHTVKITSQLIIVVSNTFWILFHSIITHK